MKQEHLFLLLIGLKMCVGLFDFREGEPKFQIQVLDPTKMELPDVSTLGLSVPMVSPVDKRKFNCYIPQPLQEPKDEVRDDPEVTPETLLSSLTQCLYRLGGWWTYEFCPKKHLRQFHQEKDKPIRPQDDFSLGRYGGKVGTIHDGYYAEEYVQGTVCDITGKPRTTQVRYICSADRMSTSLSEIIEPSSCNYVLTVGIPQLCKHSAFRPVDPTVQTITCIPEHDPTMAAESPSPQQDMLKAFEAIYHQYLNQEDDDEEQQLELRAAPAVASKSISVHRSQSKSNQPSPTQDQHPPQDGDQPQDQQEDLYGS
eukprot:TRINITY_DN17126_c0_g1_i1.p1 TRINITY_DN17126_c0_g1~~TRINITY_DN17126_c0_g1_i1.p1  ORF type:complete len:312 (+),score=92.89 TRINITY_DN17126_c0_g1_i1:61-996(+)